MKVVLELIQAVGDRKIGNHRKIIRRGVVNYVYNDVPVIIVNRQKRELIINNWNNEIHGINRVIESYLDTNTLKYLMRYYRISDRRK